MYKKKYIETPEKLYDLFTQYKTKVKSNPRIKYNLCQKTGEMVPEPLETPLTFEGFECYVADLEIISDLSHYFCNLDNRYSDYVVICSRIKKEIRNDQISGGMVGQYNASITQRLNGLTENQNITHSGSFDIDFSQ